MISKNCKYSMYKEKYQNSPYSIYNINKILTTNGMISLFSCRRIKSITAYKDGIMAEAKDLHEKEPSGRYTMSLDMTYHYFTPYTPELLTTLWGYNTELRDIVNTYLEHDCQNKEDVMTQFMARVLGAYND